MHHQHFSFWCWFIQFSVIFLIKRKWWRSYLIWCGNFKLSWHFYFRLKPQMKCKTRDCLHSQPCLDHVVTTARHLPNQSSVFNENLTRHFMFQHCQPMSNHHTERLQGGNRKINSEKVSGQSSSIQLVHPFYTSMIQTAQSLHNVSKQRLSGPLSTLPQISVGIT